MWLQNRATRESSDATLVWNVPWQIQRSNSTHELHLSMQQHSFKEQRFFYSKAWKLEMFFEPSNFTRCTTLVVWFCNSAVVCGQSCLLLHFHSSDFRGRDVPGLALAVKIILFKRVKISRLPVMTDTLSLFRRKRTHPSELGSWMSWRKMLALCNIQPMYVRSYKINIVNTGNVIKYTE